MATKKKTSRESFFNQRSVAVLTPIMLIFLLLAANACCIAVNLCYYYPKMIAPYDPIGVAFATKTLGTTTACQEENQGGGKWSWDCIGAGAYVTYEEYKDEEYDNDVTEDEFLDEGTAAAVAAVQIFLYLVIAAACLLHVFTPLPQFQSWIVQESWREAFFIVFPLVMLLVAGVWMLLSGLAEVVVFMRAPRNLPRDGGATACVPSLDTEEVKSDGTIFYQCNNYPALAVFPYDLWASFYRLSNPRNLNLEETSNSPCEPYPLDSCSNYHIMFIVQTVVNCVFGVLALALVAWALQQYAKYREERPTRSSEAWWFNEPLEEKSMMTHFPSDRPLYCVAPGDDQEMRGDLLMNVTTVIDGDTKQKVQGAACTKPDFIW